MSENFISSVSKLLSTANNIALIPHRNPDGDAMGACLALFHFFQQSSKRVVVISPNDFPAFLNWMPSIQQSFCFENQEEKCKQQLKESEVIFYLDFNSLDRVGDQMQLFLEQLNCTKVMIDHHEEPKQIANYTYSDPAKASTCEMVYEFIEKIAPNEYLNLATATCLYTGIMTDTGSFRFPATTSHTHRIIADLIDRGADNARIHSNVYDNNSMNRLQLLGKSLSKLIVLGEFKTAYICLSRQDFNTPNHKKGDTEGVVNYALSLKGIVFAVLFTEDLDQDMIKISFRSKGTFSVSAFARNYFQGGGHENAAGGRSFKSMQETVTIFKDLLPLHQTELINSYE